MNVEVALLAIVGLYLIYRVLRHVVWRYYGTVLKRRRRGSGYIYVFRGKWESPFLVKVGRSVDVVQRLKQHRTANPFGIKVLAVIRVSDDVDAETWLHRHFRWVRVSNQNEWFIMSPRLWLFCHCAKDRALTRRVQGELDS